MPRKPKKPAPAIDTTNLWNTRAFAAECGVTPQAVLKVIRDGEMPETVYTRGTARNGGVAYGFGRAALEWWRANRGEKNNVSGHGGRRDQGIEGERDQGKRGRGEAEEGEGGGGGGGGAGGAGGAGGGGTGTREQRLRAGEMLLREIIDEHGNVDKALVPRLSTPELKRYVGMQQGLSRELERKVREGQLVERTGAAREWSRRCAAAAADLTQMAARAADTIRARVGIDGDRARVVREVLDAEISRVMSQLAGGGGE